MQEYQINDIRTLIREYAEQFSEVRVIEENETLQHGWIDDYSERQAVIDLVQRIKEVTG